MLEAGKQMKEWLLFSNQGKLKLLRPVEVLEACQALLKEEETGGLVKNLAEKH